VATGRGAGRRQAMRRAGVRGADGPSGWPGCERRRAKRLAGVRARV
jgi:hypothetical protein